MAVTDAKSLTPFELGNLCALGRTVSRAFIGAVDFVACGDSMERPPVGEWILATLRHNR